MFRILTLGKESTVITNLVRRDLKSSARFGKVKEDLKDEDTFGTLSRSGQKHLAVLRTERNLPEDEDGYDKEEFDLSPRKHAFYYKYEITKYARQGKLGLKKALELHHEMKSHARLSPTVENFSPLIYGCAKAGYTKKAFELYEESTKYMKKPTGAMVTCLIDACAESPFPEYGSKRLRWFKDELKLNYNYVLDRTQYNCLIKAHGKLGELEEASKTFQAMLNEGILPDTRTFNSLLIGCVSNQNSGATLALRVYKRMKLYSIPRDIYTYNLLLTCIRDCGMGTAELIKETLGELPAMTSFKQKLLYKRQMSSKENSPIDSKSFEWLPLITDLGSSIESAITPPICDGQAEGTKLLPAEEEQRNVLIEYDSSGTNSLIIGDTRNHSSQELPNLLSEDHLDLLARIKAIKIDRLNSAPSRLMLFGGMHGILETMVKDGCRPDKRIFSIILDCTNRTRHNLTEFFRLSKDYSIKRDCLFYDLLIRKVTKKNDDKMRLDFALQFVEEMQRDGIRPNITTFESLSYGCDSKTQAERLLSDIKSSGFVVSGPLIKGLFIAAMRQYDFEYLLWLLKFSEVNHFKPDQTLLERLEQTRLLANEYILKIESKQLNSCDKPFWLSDEGKISKYDEFNIYYRSWLNKVQVYKEDHPWRQFYVESKSKKEGLHHYVQNFKTLIKAKDELLLNDRKNKLLNKES